MVNGVACAELKVETNLDVRAIDDPKPPPLNVQVISNITFDTKTGWPLEAEQVATWSGKVRESQDRVRDLKWEMWWNLKRADSARAQSSAKKAGVIAAGAKVERLAGGFKFTEGPAVECRGQCFLYGPAQQQDSQVVGGWEIIYFSRRTGKGEWSLL